MSNGQKKQEKFGKAKYKVGFLGYFDVSWLYGREPTDAALRDLLYGHRPHHRGGDEGGGGCDPLPRLSITVDKKQLRITQTILNTTAGKTGKRKIRFPAISGNDVLFVSQGSAADIQGIVGCVYHDPRSNTGSGGPSGTETGTGSPSSWPLTVHGYLFESAKAAERFARHVRQLTDTVEHRDALAARERELVDGGLLIPDPRLPAGQFLMGRTTRSTPDYDEEEETPHQGPEDLEPASLRTTEDNAGGSTHADTVTSDSSNGNGAKRRPARLPRTTLIFPEDGTGHDGNTYDGNLSSGNTYDLSSRLPRTTPIFPEDGNNHGNNHDGNTYDGSLSSVPGTDDPEPNRRLGPIPGGWTAECPEGAAVELPSSGRFDPDDDPRGESSVVRDASFSSSSSSSAGLGRLPRTRPTSCLAAEFKSKLAQGPILLPPKDYDTFSRTRGTMAGIEERKCLNPKIVGKTSSSDF